MGRVTFPLSPSWPSDIAAFLALPIQLTPPANPGPGAKEDGDPSGLAMLRISLSLPTVGRARLRREGR